MSEVEIKKMKTLSGKEIEFQSPSKGFLAPAGEEARQETSKFLKRLDEIAEKNNCLRVRLLDGLANWIERMSAGIVAAIRGYAMKISQPCVIKLPLKNYEYINKDVAYTSLGIETKEK